MTRLHTPVAFIGLGKMGQPMVRRLLGAGHRVTGQDLSAAAVAALNEQPGFQSAASAIDAVAAAAADDKVGAGAAGDRIVAAAAVGV